MTKNQMLKKLKSGTNSPDVLDWLQNLSAQEVHDFNDLDLTKKWNNLQKTPTKRRDYTWTEKGYYDYQIAFLKENYPTGSNVKWAYICHDKDKDDENDLINKHYHFYVDFPNPRSFASVANDLRMPVTNLQRVQDKAGILQYLTHENHPDKYHYDRDEVVANFDLIKEIESAKITILEEYEDYLNLKYGIISATDYLKKYELHVSSHSFKSRQEIYERVSKYDTNRPRGAPK